MEFYIITLFLISITAYVFRRNKKVLYISIFIWLTFILGFRNKYVGNDADAYLLLFDRLSHKSVLSMTKYGIEPGYNILNKIIISLGLDYQVLLIVSAAISMYFVVDFIKKHSESAHFSVWLYITFMLYQSNFTRIRQGIAIGIVLKAYDLMSKKEKIKSVIFIIIAACFHYTAIIAAIMIFFQNKKFQKKHIIALFLWVAFAVFGGKSILYLINRLFAGTKYGHYSDYGGDGQMLLILYIAIAVLIFFCRFRCSKEEDTSEMDLLCFFSIFTVFVQSLSLTVLIFNRAGEFFAVPLFLMLPNIIKYFDDSSKKMVVVSIWFFSLVMYVYMLTRVLIPYSFCWQ